MMLGISFLASVLLLRETVVGQYVSPQALVEPLYPIGLRISVPDQAGITRVFFHVKFKEDGLEPDTILTNTIRQNGRWTWSNYRSRLWKGDIIYYSINVIWEGRSYNLLDQEHQVTEFYDRNGRKITTWPCNPTDSKIFDVTTRISRDVCRGQLLLDDQFNQLNNALWTKIERFTGFPDYAFVVYRNDQRNLNVVNGKLNIVPTLTESEFGKDFVRLGSMNLESCTAEPGSQDCRRASRGAYILPPVISGSMSTKNSFAFTYGAVEVRAKLPRGDWIYPVIVLEPLETNSSSSTSELRVVTFFGNPVLHACDRHDFGGRTLFGGASQFNRSTVRLTRMPSRYSYIPWFDDYHVYELEWRGDKILSRVDGLEYGSANAGAPFDQPFYVKLGLAVGGYNEFPEPCISKGYEKPWRNNGAKALFDFYKATDLWSPTWIDDAKNLKVDYIRVWAL